MGKSHQTKYKGGGIKYQHIFKNVLHIANYQASYKGNFIESLEALSRQLEKDNIESIYMFPQNGIQEVASEWVEDLRDNKRKVTGFTDNIFSDTKQIKQIIKENHIGIIHTHFISMRQYLAVFLATMFTNVQLVMHFHNHSKQAKGVKNYLRQFLYKKCSMIGCSQSVYDNLCRDYPKNKKYAVNNGIRFERLEDETIIGRDEYKLNESTIVCLIFGFDFYRKGVDIALKALEKLNENDMKYELLISLSKNFVYVEQQVENTLGKIPEWVHIIQARSDVAALYNICDIFLSPSREEGLPYSVLEAGYCKCGIVTSNIPAQSKLGIPYCVLHKDGDFLSLAKGIEEVWNNNMEKKKNIDNVRNYMKQCYSLENWVKEIVKIYRRL